MNCHGCGGSGHIERNCPNAAIDGDGRPSWCGICDERTRLVNTAAGPKRCQQCNPNRHKLRSPLRRCPFCHMTVYEWDNGECGSHAAPAATDKRPDREHIEQIVTAGRNP